MKTNKKFGKKESTVYSFPILNTCTVHRTMYTSVLSVHM